MKTVFFNGIRFTQGKDGGYYRSAKLKVRLHRYVWEFYNGKIPDGYEVHHIDGNKDNNDISNLQILLAHEHRKLHGEKLTQEEREWRRQNLNTKARPKAIEWHKSKEGSKWHSEYIKWQRVNGIFQKELQCVYCGMTFIGDCKGKFCSNACKSAYRRASGVDNVKRNCVICGQPFYVNKYSSTQTCGKTCHANLVWRRRYENQNNKKIKPSDKSVRS